MNHALLLAALISFIAIAIRVPFAGSYADSFDSVDFALGVLDFDVFAMQPHFPGYPVLMIGAHIINQWVMDPVRSLSIISAVSGGLLSFPVYIIGSRLFHEKTGIIAALLVGLNPLLWLYSLQPMSDMPGIFFVFVSLAFLVCAIRSNQGTAMPWALAAAAVAAFGLSMGIRISYFPFALVFLLLFYYLPRSVKGYFILFFAGVVSIAVWLLPTAWHEGGLLPYWEMGKAFTTGHFTEWGGTALDSGLSLTDRIQKMLGYHLLMMGGLGWLEGWRYPAWQWLAIGLGIMVYGFYRRLPLAMITLMMMPYLVWSLAGQNADKPRHMLALVPVWMIIIAGLETLATKKKQAWIMTGLCLLAVGYGWTGWHWAEKYDTTVPPTIQLSQYIKEHYDPYQSIIFTWEEERVIEYYIPSQEAERLKSPSYLIKKVLMQSNPDIKILITNQVLDGFGEQKEEFMPYLQEIASFQESPILYPTYHRIILYEGRSDLLPYLRSKE